VAAGATNRLSASPIPATIEGRWRFMVAPLAVATRAAKTSLDIAAQHIVVLS
jgi:hypothetical protein